MVVQREFVLNMELWISVAVLVLALWSRSLERQVVSAWCSHSGSCSAHPMIVGGMPVLVLPSEVHLFNFAILKKEPVVAPLSVGSLVVIGVQDGCVISKLGV